MIGHPVGKDMTMIGNSAPVSHLINGVLGLCSPNLSVSKQNAPHVHAIVTKPAWIQELRRF